jgi:hypothetical protein
MTSDGQGVGQGAAAAASPNNVSVWRVVVKAALLFFAVSVVYFATQPMTALNRLTVYNWLVPGRTRLPFADYPAESYNLSILSIDQMIASHVIAQPKAADEFRVVLIGDSAVWGYLLEPHETQAECLNRLKLSTPDGRRVRAYNLGYPKLSVVKDALILRRALDHAPDLVIWATTLASLYPSDQLDFEVIKADYATLAALQAEYTFRLWQWPLSPPERSLIGQRRAIADWVRYQLAGVGWGATGIDHRIPKFVTPHASDLSASTDILTVYPMRLRTANIFVEDDLTLDVVRAGIAWGAAQNVPTLLINEPIYRNQTSEVRWNLYYPKWAYDSYRVAMQQAAEREGWHYLDRWDAVPADQFTDTDFHTTPAATCAYMASLREPILALSAPLADKAIPR